MNATPRSPLRDLTSSTILHDYQRDAVRNVLEALHEHRRVVLQMPTASGKTFTAMELLKALRQRGPVWFVCHRQEIILQTVRAMNEHDITCAVISPRHDAEPACMVQVASVQSLRNRWQNYPAPAVIIWDECHHAVAKTWAEWFDRFPDAWHLGLTATPERLDGKPLSGLFAHMVCGPSTRWLIDNGRLSTFKIFTQRSEDREKALQALRAGKGDYRPGDLDRVMNTPVLIGDALEHYQRHADGKRALAFCVNREASKALVAKFTEAGIPAMHVDMETPDDARKAAVEALRSGDLKMISNVDVFTEGVDIPALDAVILMRPTRSLALYLQMVGRVLRRCEGKETALVLDHAGFFWQQPGPADEYEWSLEGGARERRLSAMRREGNRTLVCPVCGYTHANSVRCEECGHKYRESDLTATPFIGDLEDAYHGSPPEGFLTVEAFSRHVGVTRTAVLLMIRDGLPAAGRYVSAEAGIRWLAEHWASDQHPPFGVKNREEYCPAGKLLARFGLSTGSRSKIKSLAPHLFARNGWMHAPSAADWLRKNWRSSQTPPTNVSDHTEYESPHSFAKSMGVGISMVSNWKSQGLPHADNGWIKKSVAKAWVEANNRSTQNVAGLTGKSTLCESQIKFAKRVGVATSAVASWYKEGIPHERNGWLPVEDAIRWLNENYNSAGRLMPYNRLQAGGIWVRDLRSRFGISDVTMAGFIRDGLPMKGVGQANEVEAIAWLKAKNSKQIHPIEPVIAGRYESGFAFAKRICVRPDVVYKLRQNGGLPCASNGWVHIRQGLQWVCEKTSMRIPPSAWEGVEPTE